MRRVRVSSLVDWKVRLSPLELDRKAGESLEYLACRIDADMVVQYMGRLMASCSSYSKDHRHLR